jgi:hypothetical protein
MLNKSGITKTTLAATRQILANVELQASVGCIVPEALGVAVGTKVIAKAGTPINVDLMDLQEAVKAPAAAVADPATPAVPMNAVLLHDVDVTAGAANGTALYFGMVNVNRVATDVAEAIEDARAIEGATQLLTFLSV